MFLSPYYVETQEGIQIAGEQASRFAKDIAGDFNPIHDPDAQRFCVPGDLLFAIVLEKYGLHQKMGFRFTGMVGKEITLTFPQTDDAAFSIVGHKGKTYLEVERSGDVSHDAAVIETLIRDYVAFSGRNFPHILAPLMKKHNVMINVDRPLVIYESMSFDLANLTFSDPTLELAESKLTVNGKRGDAELHFDVMAGGEKVGHGFKKLVLSGLREYDEAGMQHMIDLYEERKATMQRGA
jgi:hypothetical protein